MGKKNNGESLPYWKIIHYPALCQGFLVIIILLLVLSLFLSALVSFSSWQTNPRLLNLLTHGSIFIGSLWAGNRCDRKAWLHAIVTGLIAFLFFTWFASPQELFLTWFWWRSLLRVLFVSLLGGMIGGLMKT